MKKYISMIISLMLMVTILLVPFAESVGAIPQEPLIETWEEAPAVTEEPEPPSPLTPRVVLPVKYDVSRPMREMVPVPPVKEVEMRRIPFLPLPKAQRGAAPVSGNPAIVQDWLGPNVMPAPLASFDGVDNQTTLSPPDTEGDIGYDPATGTKYYFQWVNIWYGIWDVTDPVSPTQVYPPGSGFANGNTPWIGFGGYCESSNDGDPIVLFDPLADRWFMSQFALPNYPSGPFYVCIAVSQTADPTGSWYRYAYEWEDEFGGDVMNDYPKFGVWPDAYYMTVNQFNGSSPNCSGSWCGAGVAAFERDQMLLGNSAQMIAFDLAGVNINFGGQLPADLDGLNSPPPGSPGYFLQWDDATWLGDPSDSVRVWEFDVNWTTPASSTFGISGQPNLVIPTSDVNPNPSNVPQPGTGQTVDVLADRLMYRAAYRNFGSYEALVTNRTNSSGGVAAPYWFELRRSGGGPWTLYQEGEYAPGDGDHRWMGSISQDHMGNMALGYSVSSGSTYPSVRYTGRMVGDPLGTMPQGEVELVAGGGSQTGSNRWGDYSMMGIDPVDDCTFWYTQEYYPVDSSTHWYTRIGAFKFPSCSTEPTGVLSGTITDGSTANPIVGATIQAAGLVPTHTGGTTSGVGGVYSMILPTDTYTVTASAYGYMPDEINGVDIFSGTTTILDIALNPAAMYVVEGVVSDTLTGWPLYASIQVAPEGFPGTTIWNDPVTGYYSVTLPGGITHTFTVDAWVDGYDPASRQIAPLTSNQVEDFGLSADLVACTAPGYEVIGTCVPQAGGLVVGNVYDDNFGDPLVGAEVSNEDGYLTTSEPTPDDPVVEDGFYTLFSPQGSKTFTATLVNYAPDAHSVTVVQSDTVGLENFYLPAGLLDYSPDSLEDTIGLGVSSTLPLTLANLGSAPVYFEFTEGDRGVAPLGPTQYVEVTIPGTEVTHGPDARVAKRKFTYRPEINFTVEEISAPTAVIEVLLLTPDSDSSLIETTLAAFGDLNVTKWPGGADPTVGDLLPYDVVIVGNDVLWSGASMTGIGVSDALADYIDVGGKVIDTLFVYSYDQWGLGGGRYINEGYGPFTVATTDFSAIPYYLGTVYDPGHPIVDGVTAITDNPTIGYSHQDVGLAAGATRLADWNDGEIFVAYNDNVVGVNQMWYQGSNWSGNVPELMHNAILYSALADVDWLTEDPISSTLGIAGQLVVSVTLDANAPSVTQPGTYMAMLNLNNDTPYGQPSIPVTMTVLALPDWGVLEGTVYGLGHCDADPGVLEGAGVLVEGSSGLTRTLTTDVSGYYGPLWLDEAQSPYTVTVTHPDHETGVEYPVTITGQMTTMVDLNLRWLEPCVDVQAPPLEATLDMGLSTTLPMTITNEGAGALDFEFGERDRGFVPLAPTAGEDVLVVDDGDDSSATALETSLTNLGYTWLEVDVTTFAGMAIGDLLAYQAVFVAGGWNIDTEDAHLMAYLDAGGSLFIADNDLGFQYSSGGTFFNTYLQSTYVSDAGSDGVVTGVDIMAGLSTDISADPYPDDIIVGAEGVEIFTAISGNSAGVRIERAGYRAIYLAWEFEYTGAIADAVVQRAMDFLAAADVAWLSENPITGTVSADSLVVVDVTLDAGQVPQPGDYYATLSIKNNDPFSGNIGLPVTLTVNPPATWGKLEGTVTALGYCDVDPAVLDGADVLIEGSSGMTWTVTTDISGTYSYWLDETESPLTVTVTYPNHTIGSTAGVMVTGQMTTTLDFDLRWLEPCIDVDAPALEAVLDLGLSTTLPMTITNWGAADLDFALADTDDGMVPLAPLADALWLSEDPVTGTLAADGGQTVVDVTLDSSLVSLPAMHYYATLDVSSNDPVSGYIGLPVTLTVNAPANWGKLEGTVTSLGRCDNDPAPLEGVDVFVETSTGMSWTLSTASDGYYTVWMTDTESPITVSVAPLKHESGLVTGVMITGLTTTTVDFDLRWLVPCVEADPLGIDAVLDMGMSTTLPLSLTNTGAVSTEFVLRERDRGFQPMLAARIGYSYQEIPYWDETETAPLSALNDILVWGTGSPIPTGSRYRAAGTTCDGQGYYIFGGQSGGGTLLNEAWHYDPAGDTWTALANMPVALMNFEAACIDDYIYLVGGYDTVAHTNNFQIYDVAGDSWTATTWPNARTPMTAVWNGMLYAIGGNPGPSSETWVYDPGTGMWTGPLAAMPTANSYGAAVTVGDYIYQIGGGLVNTVQRYDPTSDTWDNSGPQLQDARMSALTVWYGDYIYVASGGGSGGGYWTGWNSTEVYDPSLWPGGAWAYDDETVPTSAVAMAGDCATDMIWGAGGTSGGANYDTNQYLDDGLSCNIAADDVLWLSEDPITGTLDADVGFEAVSVTLDAAYVPQPGTYYATLNVNSGDPMGHLGLPVTLTVNSPSDWGRLAGTVTGLGYCDADPAPLEDVEVFVETSTGMTLTLTTDISGTYIYWMNESESPITVTVAPAEHESGLATGVAITAQTTTTVDFDLRWLVPCVDVAPPSMEAILSLGTSEVQTLTLSNDGAVGSDFALREMLGTPISATVQMLSASRGDVPVGPAPADLRQRGESNVMREGPFVNKPDAPMQDVLLDQAPNQINGIFSDASCDGCIGGVQVVAENFALSTTETIGQIVFWTGYHPGDVPVDPDVITVTFHADAGGLPGAAISTETNVPYERVQTGVVLFGVHEWMHTLTLVDPVTLGPGTYWVEIYNDTGTGTDDMFWETGNADTVGNGLVGSAWATTAPGSGWSYDGATEMAIQLITAALDVPWLSENPITGTVSADSMFDVAITFTALPTMTDGIYTATLRVNTDDPVIGRYELPMTMTVIAAPICGFESSSPDELDQTTYFTNTTLGGQPMSYTWSFGDGTMSAVINPTHVYTQANSYTVTLTADNPYGQDVCSDVVTVYQVDYLIYLPAVMRNY